MRFSRHVLIIGSLLLCLTAPAWAQEAGDRSAGRMLARFSDAVGHLDLSPQQREQVAAVLADTRKQLGELREQNARPGQSVEVLSAARDKVRAVLSVDQQEKLRELMQAAPRPEPPKPETSKPETPKPETPKPPADEPMTPASKKPDAKPPTMDDASSPSRQPAKPEPTKTPEAAATKAIQVGQAAPAFRTKTLDERVIDSASFKGRVVVLIFGSYSTPHFRQRAAAIEKLSKDYSTRAIVYIVYTREAHAVGDWEVVRNKQDEIAIEQPTDEAGRRAIAKQAATKLKLTTPMLIDDMDNTIARGFGLTPNGVAVIGRDGAIAATQQWFDPTTLRPIIDTAAAVRNP